MNKAKKKQRLNKSPKQKQANTSLKVNMHMRIRD